MVAIPEQRKRWLAVEQATGSVRAEGLEPTRVAEEIAARWVRGEISEDEMYEETVQHYRRP